MKSHLVLSFVVLFLLSGCGLFQRSGPLFPETARVTKDEVKALLDDPDVLILDVRDVRHWETSKQKIKSSKREDPDNVATWVGQYSKTRRIILY